MSVRYCHYQTAQTIHSCLQRKQQLTDMCVFICKTHNYTNHKMLSLMFIYSILEIPESFFLHCLLFCVLSAALKSSDTLNNITALFTKCSKDMETPNSKVAV